jgi:DNA-binding HxlR family transcriptional regulator
MKKRTYKQNCSLAFASDLLGERWTLLLFRELLIQPCRFKELNLWLQGMGTNLLTNRLKELEQDGLIEKQGALDKRSAYQLTCSGRKVESTVFELIKWGYVFGKTQPEYLHYDHWDLLAMKAFFNPAKAQSEVLIQFNSPSLIAWVSISNKVFSHGFGINDSTDVVIESNIQEFIQSQKSGKYKGNKKIETFLSCFDLPESELQSF